MVDMFRRGLARLNTSVHYKQHTTNLLRENSEGWSRLIVLLTGPVALHTEPESDEQRMLRAKRVWESARELIGFFSLAPVRVYDVILEVASCHVENHWRFFLDLFRQAGLGPKEAPMQHRLDEDVAGQAQRISHALDVNPDDDTMISRTLAFRYRWYRRKKIGAIPVPFLFLTALLIKYGFVKPGHLLPALSPSEEQMPKDEKRFGDAMRFKSKARNALTDTVLVDDTLPATGAATPGALVESKEKDEESDEKMQLLQALLAIGESNFSLYLLGQYPWVVGAYPAIADIIIRNLNYNLGDLYTRIVPASGVGDNVDLVEHSPEVGLTTFIPVPPSTMTTEWRFFYDKWLDGLEVWTELEDIYNKGERWFSILKGLGGRDSELVTRVCRIISTQFRQLRLAKIEEKGFDIAHLTHDQRAQLVITTKELAPWRNLIRNTILPSLSVSETASAPFAVEVYEIFSHFDWQTTACLFGEWRDSTINPNDRNALLPAAHAANQADRDVKAELQRVTASHGAPGQSTGGATADRGPARALAKHGHGNPLALWTRGNGQVMSYGIVGNIGEFFMEVARYSGPLSKEVAVFTWVDTLASFKEPRDNNERFLKARNLENLATFMGIINRNFIFPFEPILHLIASGIKNHEWFVLPLIEKFLTGMTGEDIVENHAISTAQLKNYATGPEMSRESFFASENTCNENQKPIRSKDLIWASKKSSARLVKALVDTKLAVPILVGLGRLATEALLYEPGRPIKVMSDKKDSTRDVFSLWCAFVTDKLADLGCADEIPTLRELQGDGNIDEQMCWAILRPKLRTALAKERLENGRANGNGDGMDVDDPNVGWWPSALNETVGHAAYFLDPGARIRLGPGFLVRFNSLRISDIAFNEDAYTAALTNLSKITRELKALVSAGKNVKISQPELERIKRRTADLETEKESQKQLVERTRAELKDESQHWFAKCIEMGQDGALPNLLHDYCFYLRATQTPADAIFVARFIRLLHDLDTPGFSTIHGYNLVSFAL
jgi:THO complex subunit 2